MWRRSYSDNLEKGKGRKQYRKGFIQGRRKEGWTGRKGGRMDKRLRQEGWKIEEGRKDKRVETPAF